MRVGISTASFYNTCDLEDAPRRIAAMGADICEIFLNTFSEYAPDFIDLLHARVKEAGLRVYSVHPMGTQFEPQLYSLHPRQRADAEKIFISVLAAGKKLGARYYVLHGPAGHYGTVKNMQFSRVAPITQGLCDMAADYGMQLAWENVSWCLLHKPEYALRLRDMVEGLCFTLDIKQAARSGYSPIDYAKAMGSSLVNLHVCDYACAGGDMHPLLPGEGECDFPALRRALDGMGYDGPAFLEVYSDLFEGDAALGHCYARLRGLLE